MFAIVGAAGKVGYATSSALRRAGVPVRAVLRNEQRAASLREIGCEIALADLQHPDALGWAIANAEAVQVILPPPPRAEDAPGEMRRSIRSLAEALDRARPKRVIAISDYGAHVDRDVGMPTLFRAFEERLRSLPMQKVFLRSAEHMEGWAPLIPVVVATGILPSFHDPVEKLFPTISAPDLGFVAADLLLQPGPAADSRVVHAEGPRRYSANDVAAALSELLGRTVAAHAVPRSQWEESLTRAVSASAAGLLTKLYDAHKQGGLIDVESSSCDVRYGTTELIEALRFLVR
jgi:NAD(P)H dehydrogenase (quinone)